MPLSDGQKKKYIEMCGSFTETFNCLWCMACTTSDLWLPSQLQGISTHWLVPNYTAWWQRHMSMNWVALDGAVANIWNWDLLIASSAPNHSATEPQSVNMPLLALICWSNSLTTLKMTNMAPLADERLSLCRTLFKEIAANESHILHYLLPAWRDTELISRLRLI